MKTILTLILLLAVLMGCKEQQNPISRKERIACLYDSLHQKAYYYQYKADSIYDPLSHINDADTIGHSALINASMVYRDSAWSTLMHLQILVDTM